MSFNTISKVLVLLAFCLTLVAQNPPAQRVLVVTDTAVATDTYTGCPATAITSYVTGMEIRFLPATDNTGAATINICALGAIPIKRLTGADPDDGDVKANKYVRLVYDGTNAQIISPVANNRVQEFTFTAVGDGAVITAYTSIDKVVDKACTTRYWYVSADGAGNLTADIERATYTTGTPTYSSIKTLTLSSAQRLEDTTAVSLAAKDHIRLVISGTPTVMTKVLVLMRCY